MAQTGRPVGHGEVEHVARHRVRRIVGEVQEHRGALGQLARARALWQDQHEQTMERVVVDDRNLHLGAHPRVGAHRGVEARVAVAHTAREQRVGLTVDRDHDLDRVQHAAGACVVHVLAPGGAERPAITRPREPSAGGHRGGVTTERVLREDPGLLDRHAVQRHTAGMRRTPRSSSAPFGDGDGGPEQVLEFASQAVEYVRRALGVTLEYNSETLPVLDHYLRQVVTASASRPANGRPGNGKSGNGKPAGSAAGDRPPATALVAATAGAYFGEVVRRRLGGSWHLPSADPGSWRLVLPSGLWFWPVAMARATILGPEGDTAEPARDPDDEDDDVEGPDLDDDTAVGSEPGSAGGWDASLQAPPPLRQHVAQVLRSMADVSEEEYYSLCCRLDTLEHVQAVLAAMASARRGGSGAPD